MIDDDTDLEYWKRSAERRERATRIAFVVLLILLLPLLVALSFAGRAAEWRFYQQWNEGSW